jgi:hypothetical protein
MSQTKSLPRASGRIAVMSFSIVMVLGFLPSSAYAAATPAATHAATPAASTASTTKLLPATAPECVKVTTELKNADKVYVALQYGVIATAKAYLAKNVLVNVLAYNNSIIKVLQAANTEYKFGSSNPRCVAASTIAIYQSYLRKNLATIASIQTSNIGGQPVGAPKSWLTYIPAGLLK